MQTPLLDAPRGARASDRARASPNFMELASSGLDIGVFYDFRCCVLLLSAVLG